MFLMLKKIIIYQYICGLFLDLLICRYICIFVHTVKNKKVTVKATSFSIFVSFLNFFP